MQRGQNRVEYYNYEIDKKGDIYNNDKLLKQYKKNGNLKIKVGTKWKNVKASKFIYCAFNQDIDLFDKNYYVIKKNKNKGYEINNLLLKSKTDYMQGENNGNSKLTDIEVLEIRLKYQSGEYTYKKLAKLYNVSIPLICNIINKKARNENNYIWKKIKEV